MRYRVVFKDSIGNRKILILKRRVSKKSRNEFLRFGVKIMSQRKLP